MESSGKKRSKRPISDEGREEEEDHHSKSNRTRPSSHLLDGLAAQSVSIGEINLSPQQLATLKDFIQSVVHEVVEIQVDSCLRSILSRNGQLCDDLIGKEEAALAGSGTLKFKLFFFNQVESTIFTSNEIKDPDGKWLVVAICDTTNSNAIIEDGPLSSALVEIVVLDGKFGSGQREEETPWSASDFNNNIVSQREGKRPLIVGTLVFYLENGVGFVKGLSFTDNSSWTKSKNFRFGVRIVDEKILTGFPRIGEGVSEPFRVMDHRGEVYKKHHPPKREDEIWRLEGIGNDGAYDNRLSAENIKTVGDFLKVYYEKGAAYLRKILGKVPQIMFEKMVNHALECDAPTVPLVFDEVQDLASFNPTSEQNLMGYSLEEGEQKSFNDGHGFSAHEFGGQLQGPASYSPTFEQILEKNYEAMGLGRGFGRMEEQGCNNMFQNDSVSWVPHGEASIPYNPNHEGENATTPNGA